ncbi:MAG: pilus assembly PilX N-terminal domain-containing protein [Candidatus Zambryskibacteria bacterium]|nr:pilus assembly PilX N-terminal domain-containing protein [Candidatus Zambryskibacteria bacterium]
MTKGFTLLIAIVVMGTVLLVAAGVTNLAVKQSLISSTGRDSQYAFYAADTGLECALYWDVHNPTGVSAFSTSTGSVINCNNQSMTVGGTVVSTFTLNLNPDPFCTAVTVTKRDDGSTAIESRGYNSCDTSNPRRVERAVRATY